MSNPKDDTAGNKAVAEYAQALQKSINSQTKPPDSSDFGLFAVDTGGPLQAPTPLPHKPRAGGTPVLPGPQSSPQDRQAQGSSDKKP